MSGGTTFTIKDAETGLMRKVLYDGLNDGKNKIRIIVHGKDGVYSEELSINSDRIVCFGLNLALRIIEAGGDTGRVRVQISDFLYDGCIKEYTEKYPNVNWQIL